MTDDEIPKNLPARTGKHICTNCLREVEPDEYFSHDLACAECAADGEFPLASTDGVGDDDSSDRNGSQGDEPPAVERSANQGRG